MENVMVSRDALLEKLQENRSRHRSIFLEAQRGYRAAVIGELDRMLAEARDGKAIRRRIELPEPCDHTADYDVAISMVGMSISSGIALSEYDFRRYVMDEWDWSKTFSSTSQSYSASSSSP